MSVCHERPYRFAELETPRLIGQLHDQVEGGIEGPVAGAGTDATVDDRAVVAPPTEAFDATRLFERSISEYLQAQAERARLCDERAAECVRNAQQAEMDAVEDAALLAGIEDLAERRDVGLVVGQAGCHVATAQRALRRHNGNIVDAIMELMM